MSGANETISESKIFRQSKKIVQCDTNKTICPAFIVRVRALISQICKNFTQAINNFQLKTMQHCHVQWNCWIFFRITLRCRCRIVCIAFKCWMQKFRLLCRKMCVCLLPFGDQFCFYFFFYHRSTEWMNNFALRQTKSNVQQSLANLIFDL